VDEKQKIWQRRVMIDQVEMRTERLILRAFRTEDAKDVQRLAGDREVARTTLNIPHPYKDGMAEEWIATHAGSLEDGTNLVYAIVEAEGNQLLGAINVAINQKHRRGNFGYWIGRSFWGRGFCTEAAGALLACCFDQLGLHRVHAHYLAGNLASGRVMEKIGMKQEGCLREHIEKDGKMHDVIEYGILSSDYIQSP
jgi:ribosomal-protein-alanine N-acetyltransferase